MEHGQAKGLVVHELLVSRVAAMASKLPERRKIRPRHLLGRFQEQVTLLYGTPKALGLSFGNLKKLTQGLDSPGTTTTVHDDIVNVLYDR